MQQSASEAILARYFEAIAESHSGIQQFLSGEEGMLAKAQIPILNGMLLWFLPVKCDESESICECSLYICQAVGKASASAVERKLLQCEKVVKQIRARLLAEYNEGVINASFSKFRYKPVPEFSLSGQAMLGIRLSFVFPIRGALQYDPAAKEEI